MKKLKKALSLSLALALSLALTVPAMAAESNYKLEVSGKPDAFMGERTFTVRDWDPSDPYEDEDGYLMVSLAKTDSHAYTVSNLYVVSKGDTMVFTKGGKEFPFFILNAWSDPDRDGVYDSRVWSYEENYVLWPADTAGPLHASIMELNSQFYLNHWPDGSGISYDMPYIDSNYKIVLTTEAKLSADTLLEEFGPNTLVVVSDNDWSCAILVEGEAAQPTVPTTPVEPEQPTQPEQPTTPTTPVTPDAPGTYTVKKGDTWSSICTNFYGTNGQRYELMKANKGVALIEGAVITLPEKLGKDTLLPAAAAGEGEKLYTVKLGDTLGKIAAAEYGKASEYKAIFERNADRLKNANTIYEGQVIVLPVKK